MSPKHDRLFVIHIGIVFVSALFLSGCNKSATEPVVLRLVDEFDPAKIEGASTAPSTKRPPTMWRFNEPSDREGMETLGWKPGPGVTALSLRDGSLAGSSTTDFPIIHVERTEGLDDSDVLHTVEVRLRASKGTNLSIRFAPSEKVDFEGVLTEAKQFPWTSTVPIVAGNEMQTYTLSPSTDILTPSFPSSQIRHILLRPTDVSGADFEIESVRLIFREEHLASIASGVSWQGFSNVFRETLVTRAPERAVFRLKLPAKPFLDLTVGTLEPEPVGFRVELSRTNEKYPTPRVVLRRQVTTPHRWEHTEVDLSNYAGEEVELSLSVTAGENGTLGFWGAPVIRSRGAIPAVAEGKVDPPQGVILIVADTLRRDHLDAYGYERETAPVLRQMASEGALFLDTQSQGSWTKVSVPAIMTSLYPTTHGVRGFKDRVPMAATTIAEVYRKAGYATFATSSVAFSGRLSNLHQGVEALHERASLTLPDGQSDSKTARAFLDRALEWLETHSDVPFFIFLHAFDPHSPFEPYQPYDSMWAEPGAKAEHDSLVEAVRPFIEDPFMKRLGHPTKEEIEKAGLDPDAFVAHEIEWYDGSIRAMDAEIGRLLESLRQLGLEDKTMIAFVSDHGEEFLEHGRHWHGNTIYGEMSNVPLILWGPGRVPAGVTIDETVQSIDLMPTLLELSGLSSPENVQGQSLVPLMASEIGGKDGSSNSAYAHGLSWQNRPAFIERVRIEGLERGESTADSYAIVWEGWKLIQNTTRPPGYPEYELFDHNKDPLNLVNVAEKHPDVVEQLARKIDQWQKQAMAERLPPDEESTEGISAQELEKLRALGYVQ